MQTNFSQLTSSERRWCMQRGLCLCCGADSHHSVPSETTLCISKFSSYCSSHSFSILFQSHSDQWPFFCCSYSPHQFGRIIRFSGQLIHQLHLQAIPCSISLLIISIVGKPLGGGIITSLWICFPMYRLYSPREHFTSGSGGLHSHPGTSLVGIAFIPPSHGPCFKATQPRRAYTVYSSSEKKKLCRPREWRDSIYSLTVCSNNCPLYPQSSLEENGISTFRRSSQENLPEDHRGNMAMYVVYTTTAKAAWGRKRKN